MVKTTFTERFERTAKFYDFTYHLHKSTFKGLSQFYKDYSDVEKRYADGLIKLTQDVWSQMPDLRKQNATLLKIVKQIFNCLQTGSQLHYNYAQRLTQVSTFYYSQYQASKKIKQKQMKIIRDRNRDEYEELRDKEKRREVINGKEKDICKMLYQNLDKLTEQQNDRVHKVKEQTIIYFSLYRKIVEKQLEKTNEHNLKLVHQQFHVQNKAIQEIADVLIDQHNGYEGQKLARKSYDLSQTMVFNRSSLRASLQMKERLTKVEDYKTQLRKTVAKYQQFPNQLYQMAQGEVNIGVFLNQKFDQEKRRKYGRQIDSTVLKTMFYDMFEAYSRSKGLDSDSIMSLQIIKTGLRIQKEKDEFSAQNLKQFWAEISIKKQQYRWHAKAIQVISQIYETQANSQKLQSLMKNKNKKVESDQLAVFPELSFLIKSTCLDVLLESLCVIRQRYPILIDDYIDILTLIAKFGEQFLKIERNITVLLLLRKLQRFMKTAKKTNIQTIQQILKDPYFRDYKEKRKTFMKQSDEKRDIILVSWIKLLINDVTDSLISFYKINTPLINLIKILLVLQKLQLVQFQLQFNSQEHFYFCMKSSGYAYLKQNQESKRLLDESVYGGTQRLKCIVQAVQELDYHGVIKENFDATSQQLSSLIGVGHQIIRNKMIQQFTFPILDIIDVNLKMLSQQEGIDRQGYALRLGIVLAKLDIENPLPIHEYDPFFKVLQKYLESTQQDYNQMLQHSRKTQLWIMQENAQATSNCIDFCSLLYKPFQFLLISLKQLEEEKQTQYTKKYAQFIKLRLNTILKEQIIKYVNFLYQSLTVFESKQPQINLKPKRFEKLQIADTETIDKQKYTFKEITRRLFNILFLKEQLEEMISEFVDKDLYKQMDYSIFNIDKLQKLAGQRPQSRVMLFNIKQIVEAMLANQEKILTKIANITVYYFMKRMFTNLYFQQQKNAIEEFFSNSNDYKLSEETFVKYQNQIQNWFILISKNIPEDFIDSYYTNFLNAFFNFTRYQTLNSSKFKLPFSQPDLIRYLDKDSAFISTIMKQKYIKDELVFELFQMPHIQLLQDLESPTPKLMGIFEDATLKNDKEKCKYILVILNLRVKDEKAIEFIKKYKSIALK